MEHKEREGMTSFYTYRKLHSIRIYFKPRQRTLYAGAELRIRTAISTAITKIVTWWQERKATLHQASDASRETERTTFHVEKHWIEAIRRQADLDHLTITQVVNEAFRHHFEGK